MNHVPAIQQIKQMSGSQAKEYDEATSEGEAKYSLKNSQEFWKVLFKIFLWKAFVLSNNSW